MKAVIIAGGRGERLGYMTAEIAAVGDILHKGWLYKKELASGIS